VSNSQSPPELSISEFVEAYLRRIAQLPGCDKVVFDPVNRVIRFEYQGQAQFARPQTAYAEYKLDRVLAAQRARPGQRPLQAVAPGLRSAEGLAGQAGPMPKR
jgi:hypothetical protein